MRADHEHGLRPLLGDVAEHTDYETTERLVLAVRARVARHTRRRLASGVAVLVLVTIGGTYLGLRGFGGTGAASPRASGVPTATGSDLTPAPIATPSCPPHLAETKLSPPTGTPPPGPLTFTPTVGMACRFANQIAPSAGAMLVERPLDPATLRSLPALLNGHQPALGAYPCPYDDGGADVLVLAAPGHMPVQITVHRTGCRFVSDGTWSWFPAPQLADVLNGLLS